MVGLELQLVSTIQTPVFRITKLVMFCNVTLDYSQILKSRSLFPPK